MKHFIFYIDCRFEVIRILSTIFCFVRKSLEKSLEKVYRVVMQSDKLVNEGSITKIFIQ